MSPAIVELVNTTVTPSVAVYSEGSISAPLIDSETSGAVYVIAKVVCAADAVYVFFSIERNTIGVADVPLGTSVISVIRPNLSTTTTGTNPEEPYVPAIAPESAVPIVILLPPVSVVKVTLLLELKESISLGDVASINELLELIVAKVLVEVSLVIKVISSEEFL